MDPEKSTAAGNQSLFCPSSPHLDSAAPPSFSAKLGFVNFSVFSSRRKTLGLIGDDVKSTRLSPIKAVEASKTSYDVNAKTRAEFSSNGTVLANDSCDSSGGDLREVCMNGRSTNIVWHKCSVDKIDRQELLQQKGCVLWITGLSGSGKSTLACAISRALHARGKLTYVLDGENVRHGLNSNLTFEAEARAENIRRVGEVSKLFADAGVICIASLISPYRRDRDACRSLLPEGDFIEIYMDVPLRVCEARDPKGLYKLARAGKIKGFTGIDDPYEPPLKCELILHQEGELSRSPCNLAEEVISYLDVKGYLQS